MCLKRKSVRMKETNRTDGKQVDAVGGPRLMRRKERMKTKKQVKRMKNEEGEGPKVPPVCARCASEVGM